MCCSGIFTRCEECDPAKRARLRCEDRRIDDEDGGFIECEDMVLNLTDVELEEAKWPAGGTLEIEKLEDGTYLLFLWYPPKFAAEQASRGVNCRTFSVHGTLRDLTMTAPLMVQTTVATGFTYDRPFPQVTENDFLTRAELLERIRATPDVFFGVFCGGEGDDADEQH